MHIFTCPFPVDPGSGLFFTFNLIALIKFVPVVNIYLARILTLGKFKLI